LLKGRYKIPVKCAITSLGIKETFFYNAVLARFSFSAYFFKDNKMVTKLFMLFVLAGLVLHYQKQNISSDA